MRAVSNQLREDVVVDGAIGKVVANDDSCRRFEDQRGRHIEHNVVFDLYRLSAINFDAILCRTATTSCAAQIAITDFVAIAEERVKSSARGMGESNILDPAVIAENQCYSLIS